MKKLIEAGFSSLDDIDKALGRLRQLIKGWDSYGASPPNRRAARIARRYIRRLNNSPLGWPDQLIPDAEGGIVVKYELSTDSSHSRVLTIACGNDGHVVLVVNGDGLKTFILEPV